jgi:HD-GYP domain-containing protein (c-di-GMP phosphodiesterase class II)
MLHDVGKSKIDHGLINKSGKLTDEEFEQMKFHALAGGEILTGMKYYTHNVVSMAAQHHEKFKGGTTQRGLKPRRSIVLPASAK